MRQTAEPTGDADSDARPDEMEGVSVTSDVPRFLRPGAEARDVSWSFVGFVVAAIIVVVALSAVSEIILPMTFAAVLAVCLQAPRRHPRAAQGQAHPGGRHRRPRPARPDGRRRGRDRRGA